MVSSHRAKGLKLLFLTPQLPYPPEQGAAIRNYNLILEAAKRHEVDLLSFAPVGADTRPMEAVCRAVRAVPAPSRSRRERLMALLTSSLPDMAWRLRSEAFARALEEMLAEGAYDLVQVEGIEMAPYGLMALAHRKGSRPKMIYDAHNAEYLLQRRAFETDLRHPKRWPSALYSLIQWRRLARFERCVCRLADAVVAVSEADAAALRAWCREVPLVVPNGVDVARYHPGLGDTLPLEHPAIVFTGKMDFRPNVDAILWFYDSVWPLVRREAPGAVFYVVGSSPHRALDRLRADPSVRVTGYVADILPYFGGADVYVVPMRIGGGTRLKVLEAMAAGLPLVSTRLGAEGIRLLEGEHALLADDPKAFAEAILCLLRDRARAAALGRAARAFVMAHYAWEHLTPAFEALYERLM